MASSDPIIFKILNGVQAGVEVSLPDGEYALGSGPADDIQLIDVTLLPRHARLRLSGTVIEVAGGDGALRTFSGLSLQPGSAFQAVEPLDILTAGTTRFALAPRSANWASIGDDRGGAGDSPPAPAPVAPATARDRIRVLGLPVAALALVLGLAGWLIFGTGLRSGFKGHDASADVATLRTALDAFPFGRPIAVRQEVDGAVYAEGYVGTPVERRALAGAIESAAVPARVRLWVLDSMRADIRDLVAAQKVDVSFELSPQGALTLSGVILDKARADAFVTLVRDRIFGLASVTSTIKTGDTLLADVRKLVATSQLQPWLLLRLDKELIEVDGALPSDKVDAWVGFLQSYADKFARQIALRSFVQLQAENGKLVPAPTGALVLGAADRPGDNPLDLGKVRSGRFDLGDVFVGVGETLEKRVPGARSSRRESPPLDNAPGPRAANGGTSDAPAPRPVALGGVDPGRAPATAQAAAAAPDGSPLPERGTGGAGQLANDAKALLRRFRNGDLANDPTMRDLYSSLLLLGDDPGGQRAAAPAEWYLPLLSGYGASSALHKTCWAGSQLEVAALLPTLFWLDLMSAGRSLSLKGFPRDQTLLLLEAALDPAGVRACAALSPETARAADRSLYLREVRRNPGFVRFVTRDLPDFSLDVAGASLGTERYILTQAGDKLFEGAAPDRGSRLALVGELGLVIQTATGPSVVLFGPSIDWIVSN